MSTTLLIGAWVATGLSLFMYSFLYKDNPFFKLGEHIYVGVSVGYGLVITYYEVMVKKLYVPMVQQGNWWLVIPLLLGLLVLARFIPAIAWLSRISFAFIVGFGSGTAIPRQISLVHSPASPGYSETVDGRRRRRSVVHLCRTERVVDSGRRR